MLELDGSQEFDPAREEEFFAAVPERAGILLIEMREPRAHPHLVRTADLRRAETAACPPTDFRPVRTR